MCQKWLHLDCVFIEVANVVEMCVTDIEFDVQVPGDVEIKKSDAHLTSAAAFVEGGIQDACDDACSICLEDFSESDPSTVYADNEAFFFLYCFFDLG